MSGRIRTANLDRATDRSTARRARAFTLTEMLVAVALLSVVILATSAIVRTDANRDGQHVVG